MPTTLLIVYRVLGTVLFALAAAAIVEKYAAIEQEADAESASQAQKAA